MGDNSVSVCGDAVNDDGHIVITIIIVVVIVIVIVIVVSCCVFAIKALELFSAAPFKAEAKVEMKSFHHSMSCAIS